MYQLVIVSKLSESDGLLSRVEKALKDAEASEVKVEKLGKKQLAYPIKKQTEGDYTVVNFDAAGAVIADLSSMLRLEQEALLRHLLIKQKIRVKPRKKLSVRKVEPEVKAEAPKVTVVTKTATKESSEKTKAAKEKVTKSDKISKEKTSKAKKVTKAKK